MQLVNEAVIAAPPERVWATLVDLAQVATAMPGASLEGQDGDRYLGRMKVKVGPVGVEYRGTVRFVSLDEAARDAVLEAAGSDLRGQGTASAQVHARLSPAGAGTTLRIETDLQISGRVAQFGRGALQDVSAQLLTQFTKRLEAVMSAAPAGAAPAAGSNGAAPLPALEDDAPALDAGPLIQGLILKRLPAVAGVLGALTLLFALVRLARGRGGVPAGAAAAPPVVVVVLGEGAARIHGAHLG